MIYAMRSGVITVAAALSAVVVCASPAGLIRNHDQGAYQKVRSEDGWERQPSELQQFGPTQEMFADGYDEGRGHGGHAEPGPGENHPPMKINETGFGSEEVLPFAEDIDHPFRFIPTSAYSIGPDHLPMVRPPREEEDVRDPAEFRSDHVRDMLEALYPAYPGGEEDYEEYASHAYEPGPKRIHPRDAAYPSGAGYESLAQSLARLLGSPEEDWEVGRDIDFGSIWEADPAGEAEGSVPGYTVEDAADPEVDENLLELMVRIAEDPVKWRLIHGALQALDDTVSSNDKIPEESHERKEVEKRSSPYGSEEHFQSRDASRSKRKKLTKLKKKRRKKTSPFRLWTGEEGASGSGSAESREFGYGPRGRSEYLPFDDEQRIRHSPYPEPHAAGRGGPFHRDDHQPRSAAYASVVFPSSEDVDFDQWKVHYRPVEPEDIEGGLPKDYERPQWTAREITASDRFAKKRLKMKALARARSAAAKGAKPEGKEKGFGSGRRVELSKLSKSANGKVSDEGKEKKEAKAGGEDARRAKQLSLPANTWVTPKEPKNWPRFAYHRVTSSPTVQQREAGAQARHRSAYVAVSVIPTNSTGMFEGKTQLKRDKIKLSHQKNHDHRGDSTEAEEELPDLYDRFMQEEKAKAQGGSGERLLAGKDDRNEFGHGGDSTFNRTT